jgi:hypothetical protein
MGTALGNRFDTNAVSTPQSTVSIEDELRKKKKYAQVASQKGRGEFFKNAPATSSPLSSAGGAGSGLLKQKLGE